TVGEVARQATDPESVEVSSQRGRGFLTGLPEFLGHRVLLAGVATKESTEEKGRVLHARPRHCRRTEEHRSLGCPHSAIFGKPWSATFSPHDRASTGTRYGRSGHRAKGPPGVRPRNRRQQIQQILRPAQPPAEPLDIVSHTPVLEAL